MSLASVRRWRLLGRGPRFLKMGASVRYQPEALQAAWSTFRRLVSPFLGSIGRIEDAKGQHVGTGFVVGTGDVVDRT